MDLSNAASSLASWEVCMSNSYCKYPVIIGIVVGVIVIITLVFCLFRCMGCCTSCCGSCLRCGGSRKKQGKNAGQYSGFQPGPPPPVPHLSQNQYDSPQQPMYAQHQPSPYRGTHTATFDAPSKATGRYNEDSLPAMPSWADGRTKHVEDEMVELDRLHSGPENQSQIQQPQPHVLSGYDDTASAAEHFNATPYSPVTSTQPIHAQSSRAQPLYAQSNNSQTNYVQPNYAQSDYAQQSYSQSNYGQPASPYGLRSNQPDLQYEDGQLEAQPHAYTTNAYTPTAYMPDMPSNDYNDSQQYIAAAAPNPARSPPPPRSLSATRAPYQSRSISATRSPPPPPRSISATRTQPPRDTSATRSPQLRDASATRSPPLAQRSISATRHPNPPRSPDPVNPMRSADPLRSPSTTRSPPRSADPVRTPPALAGLVRSLSQSTAGHGSVLPLYSQPVSPTSVSTSTTTFTPSTVVPTTYQTRPASARSPPPQPPTEYGGYVPRRPVQGSWRDV